jgi:hypothetical protein
MSAIDGDDLLAVLEERPYLEEELVALAGVSADVIRFALKQLARAKKVKRVGTERRWALATYQAPLERPHLTKPARVLRDVEQVDEDLDEPIDDADETDAAEDELLDASQVEEDKPNRDKLLGAGGRRMYPAGTRQKASRKPAVADAPAWWVKHAAPDQRESFKNAAAERNAEMCATSPGWRSQTTVRQERETR